VTAHSGRLMMKIYPLRLCKLALF